MGSGLFPVASCHFLIFVNARGVYMTVLEYQIFHALVLFYTIQVLAHRIGLYIESDSVRPQIQYQKKLCTHPARRSGTNTGCRWA